MQELEGSLRGTEPLLEARGLSKSYGHVVAVARADIAVRPAEIVAIVGDNGAGKSTLLKCLCGAVRPDEGDLFLDGQPVRFNTPRQARSAGISVVYQDLALVDGRDVSHNMFLGALPVRGPMVDRGLMDRVSTEIIGELAKNPPPVRTAVSLLSGGQRQLVAIGRAVRERSRLIFLDEPTAALGVQESQHVLEILRGLRDNRGISIAVISHNLEHVFSLADRIVIMRRGRIVGERRRAESTTSDVVALITGAVGADVAP